MPSPFPGMNPYLEHPQLWEEVHSRLIVAIADALGPQLRPKYRVAIEKRVYENADDLLIGRPDGAIFRAVPDAAVTPTSSGGVLTEPIVVEVPMPEEVTERYLEIREVETGEVITTLELLSPSNKKPGKGRQVYEAKRLAVLGSLTHLLEIDLIRAFKPLPVRGAIATSLYRILVSRADLRPKAALYAFNLPDPIPVFPIPLRPEDPEILLDLQFLLNQVYDRASYDLAIDYTQEPVPPLQEADAKWADAHLKAQKLR
ncbi:DUF4058 family protein [Microcoleus sp. FACHB-1515]|uniref:DUF4058 family protein n=1 Tax=Cyanophyceae TaxID=3028117 RepID=UPI001684D0CF|nr:DUF4058 family protein [Microcoleus sp. FACHB-1515]MBD2093459.1 DUF4058 family protein [Microcoleus sp. FACHB-1515]